MTQLEVSNGDVLFFDKDRVLQRVVKPSGRIVVQRSAAEYALLGLKEFDFPLQIGKEWEYLFEGKNLTGITGSYRDRKRITACEDLTTPAGKLEAFKIEAERSNLRSRASGIFFTWYAPQVKHFVKRLYVSSEFWKGAPFGDFELHKV